MRDKADVLDHVCAAIDAGPLASAASVLETEYPFSPISKIADCFRSCYLPSFHSREIGNRTRAILRIMNSFRRLII